MYYLKLEATITRPDGLYITFAEKDELMDKFVALVESMGLEISASLVLKNESED
jgi:hypothetical protein